MKKILFALSCIFLLFISINIFAFKEIKEYGVDISLAYDISDAKEIRESEYVVSDARRFINGYDMVRFNDLYNGLYDVDTLYKNGYRTIVCEIELTMREINKGYQYIYIYDNTKAETWLSGCKYELGGTKKISVDTTVTFYAEINLANITNNDFVIRYDASRKDNDNWINKDVKIFVGFSKDTQKTQNMWELKHKGTSSYTASKLPFAK